MLNLQTVTEDLGTACGGKAWIVVTSQQDIDSITKTMGEDFSKIQGRFATRIALSSADADEVIKKRIFYKNKEARLALLNLYQEYESSIKNIITFSEGTPNMSLYKDAEEFADVYPFIPYQFQLAGHVLTAVRQFSSSGKHLADGERSLLALFKEAAVSYANEEEGVLVPFHEFYRALDDFIDHTNRIVITQISWSGLLSSHPAGRPVGAPFRAFFHICFHNTQKLVRIFLLRMYCKCIQINRHVQLGHPADAPDIEDIQGRNQIFPQGRQNIFYLQRNRIVLNAFH